MEEQTQVEIVSKDFKLSDESAKAIFNEFLEYYDIAFSDIISERGQNAAEQLQKKIVRAIQRGDLQTQMSDKIEEGLQIIQTTSRGVVITYNEYNATANMEADKGRSVAETYYRLLGSLCGKGVDFITNKKNFAPKDLKIAECLAVLFLMQ